MKNLQKSLVFLCLVGFCFSQTIARRRRTQYLTHVEKIGTSEAAPPIISPYIKTITQKNKKLSEELRRVELEAQEELIRSQKKSDKIRQRLIKQEEQISQQLNEQVKQLQRKYDKTIDNLKKKFEKETKGLFTEKEKKLNELRKKLEKEKVEHIRRTREETLRKINFAEEQILKKHFGRGGLPASAHNKKSLSRWKKHAKKTLKDSVAYLKSIISDDRELTSLLRSQA